MSGATDSGMKKAMVMVIGVIAFLAIACGILAKALSPSEIDLTDPIRRQALVERIQPVASARTSTDDLPIALATVAMAEEASAEPLSGEELVGGACASCHAAGIAGAPVIGDTAVWADRSAAGLDALVSSVVNGKGAMPPRGGTAYSDEEIQRAVQFLIGE